MFETEDGIFDTSGYNAEQEKDFFTMYPDAKEVEDGYSFSDTYSSSLPEKAPSAEGIPNAEDDALLNNIKNPKNLQLDLEAPEYSAPSAKSFLSDYLEEEEHQNKINDIFYQGGDIASQTLSQQLRRAM